MIRPAVVNLLQLKAELAAVGIIVTALGTNATDVFTYNGQGQPIDLPPEAQVVVDAHVAVDEDATIRSPILTAAQSSVGVLLTALTTNQQRALLACLLYKAGGVTLDLKVKPLATWLNPPS